MRYYNHIDLDEIGEEEGRFAEQQEATYQPVYYCRIEAAPSRPGGGPVSSFQIFVNHPFFSNPVFERAFRNYYRVGWAKSHSPYQLDIHLKQASFFTEVVRLDLHRVFDEVMKTMICRTRIKMPVIPLKPPISKAS